MCSKVLKTREEFVNTANLGAVDILAVRLWLDRKVPSLHWHWQEAHVMRKWSAMAARSCMHSSRGENQTPYKIDHLGLHKRWTSEIDDAGNSFDVQQPDTSTHWFMRCKNRFTFPCPAMPALGLILLQDGHSLISTHYMMNTETSRALLLKLTL